VLLIIGGADVCGPCFFAAPVTKRCLAIEKFVADAVFIL
jgi:hypothetical protein